MTDKILFPLNEKQSEAVMKPLIPVLVIAGPGTGKTRLLVSRIAWLITEKQLNPEKILAITFTNKAAFEMKMRLMELVGQIGQDIFTGTFHSFALNLLRKYHARLKMSPFFSVCDQDYQLQLLIKLCSPYIKENIDLKVKGILLSFSNHFINNKPLSVFAAERFAEYKDHLKEHHLIDFDQILHFCRLLLLNNKDVLDEYRYLYPAILVDEFQDTDPVQYEIIRLLAEKSRNIFVVADDDQSIYSWRGADPENIRKFIEDFAIADPIILEENYRNGDKILTNAYDIISRTERIDSGKTIRTGSTKANEVEVKFFLTEQDEVDFILKKIQKWVNKQISYSEIAIIYPFHKIGQSLEPHILKKQIPYQMATGKSILEYPLVKRMVLFLKFIRDPEDPISLEELARIELGESLFSLIKHLAIQQRCSFRKILYQFYIEENGKLPYDSLLKIKNFIAHIANLINLKGFFRFNQLLEEIFLETDPQAHSALFQYRKELDDFQIIDTITEINKADLSNCNIYIFHPNDRISYLAGKLIKKLFSNKVERINPDTTPPQYSEKDVLIELLRWNDKKFQGRRIPVYALENANRQGSLSNLFKFLQWYTSKQDSDPFQNYTVLDLETTDKDKNTCGIVEIAAVKVENNKIVNKLHSLINPKKRISKGAQNVHHISEEDIKNAPSIEKLWPQFVEFVGNDILIAHNGYNFDFPILDRFAKKITGKKLPNIRIDTLVIARNIFPTEPNSIDALMTRFNFEADTRHRALEDVLVLVKIMKKLQSVRLEIGRLTSLEQFLDIVALSNFIENKIAAKEDRLFFITGGRKLHTAYSKVRTEYTASFDENESNLIGNIREKLKNLNSRQISYQKNDHILDTIQSMAVQLNHMDFEEAVAHFLTYLSLNSSQDQLSDINAVSLLTYHSAKGLEFDKVILMGMENKNMPGFHALREDNDDDRPISKKLEEQRRLFYVGMTRAKTELVMTAVKNRGGWEHESSPFLKDLSIFKKQ